MKCEVLRNNQRVIGPVDYNVAVIGSVLASMGADPAIAPVALTAPVRSGTVQILPVREVRPTLGLGQRHVNPTRSVSPSAVTYTYTVDTVPAAELRNRLTAALSEAHDRYENGFMEYKGVLVRVDLESRTNAQGALERFKAGKMTSVSWRGRKPNPASKTELGLATTLERTVLAINSTTEMEAFRDAMFDYLDKGHAARNQTVVDITGTRDNELANFDAAGRFTANLSA